MEGSSLAIVEISFPGQSLEEKDAQKIEALLRQDGAVNNLSIHNDKMVFFIWGKNNVDYQILDQIKNKLPKDKIFVISADEYKETGKKYYHASKAVPKK